MKLVSVIIPYFKKIRYINKAINSILKQTYKNFEVIIVYDDESLEDLKIVNNIKKKDKRIKVIVNKKNLGAGYSRNKGIKISKGNIIAFLDADDYWKKNKLKKQIDFMKKYSCDFVHSSYFIVNKKNKVLDSRIAPKLINYQDLEKSCDIGLSTVMINKKIFKKIKFPKLKTKEDYVVWLKISKKKIKIFGIKEKLVFWRNLENSLSSNLWQKLKDGYFVYRKYLRMSMINSLFSLFILSLNFIKKKNKI